MSGTTTPTTTPTTTLATTLTTGFSPRRAIATGWHLGMFDPTAAAVLTGAAIRTGPSPALPYAMAALRFPTRTAIADDHGTISYWALHRRIERIAGAMHRAGIDATDRIGILCRNHRGFVELTGAVARIGATPVYLNTGFGHEQLGSVVRSERIAVVFHDLEFTGAVATVDAPCRPVAPEADPDWSFPDLEPSRLAFVPPVFTPATETVLLTSGTTGTPKGAHRDLRHTGLAALGALLALPHRRGARTVIAAPLFHAWGLSQLATAAVYAQTVVLRREFDAERTLADMGHHRAEALIAVPVMLERLLAAAPGGDSYIRSNLRFTATSGAPLRGDLALRWMDAYGDSLYNFYGSTEVGHVTVAAPADLRRAPGTAGRPAPGTEIRLLDDDDNPVPEGDVGRIVVRNGAHFAGYTGGGSKPTIDDFMEIGDLGRIDEHGLLHVTGRADDMVVSGGENVFPGEVEAFLLSIDGVADAAVVGVDDAEFGQALFAAVVAVPGVELDVDDIAAAVKTSLATFKVPRRIVVVDRIPRNPTGKIVRGALPAV